tara:strand:+ start:1435 stop:2457 length:1023 start_codon:yes stop_codon:yes gene_type:complete
MKKIQNNKKGILSKFFVKICRLFGYEIIDQSDFSVPTLGKDLNDNLSIPGKKSITVPLGEIKITRNIKSFHVIVKTCTSVNLVTQNKSRIFEKNKSEYTFKTINSLINSLKYVAKTIQKLPIKITIIDHNSQKNDLKLIENKLKNSGINFKILNLDLKEFSEKIKTLDKNNLDIEKNMKSTMSSIYKSFLLAKEDDNDLIYFVEDDYIHERESLIEMLLTYEKLSSLFKNEIFLCPVDYPYLYKSHSKSAIFLGHKRHWRTVNESLLTFMTSKKMIEKYWEKLITMSEKEHSPFETPLHEIYEKEICLSPIPSLAMHCTNINSVFGLSPNVDWKKLWDEN